jgi:hypothetical protein
MGCKTCKNKKKPNQSNNNNVNYESVGSGDPNVGEKEEDILNLIPEAIQNGDFSENFWFKFVAFIVILIAIPLVIVILVCKMFLTFFVPKALPKVGKKVSKFFMSGFNMYAMYRQDREIKRRNKEFAKNVGYDKVPDPAEYEDDYVDADYDEVPSHDPNYGRISITDTGEELMAGGYDARYDEKSINYVEPDNWDEKKWGARREVSEKITTTTGTTEEWVDDDVYGDISIHEDNNEKK